METQPQPQPQQQQQHPFMTQPQGLGKTRKAELKIRSKYIIKSEQKVMKWK